MYVFRSRGSIQQVADGVAAAQAFDQVALESVHLGDLRELFGMECANFARAVAGGKRQAHDQAFGVVAQLAIDGFPEIDLSHVGDYLGQRIGADASVRRQVVDRDTRLTATSASLVE